MKTFFGTFARGRLASVGLVTRRSLGMTFLLALPFSRTFAQNPTAQLSATAQVSTAIDDVSLNDRRLQIVERLASSDNDLAHYLSEFKRANPEGKIDVFDTAYADAAGRLTEVAESRVSSHVYRGILGALVRMLGVPILDSVIAQSGKGGTPLNTKKEGDLADVGLENAKAVVGRFLSETDGAAFEAARPTEKTLPLLRALRLVNTTQEQPGPYVIWGNDLGRPGSRGVNGQKSVGLMLGTNDARYTGWASLNRSERDQAVTASIERYFERAMEAVQDESGEKAKALAVEARGGPRESVQERLRRTDPSGKLSKVFKNIRPPAQQENLTDVRAFGTGPKTEKEAAEAQPCGEIMAMAWRPGVLPAIGRG